MRSETCFLFLRIFPAICLAVAGVASAGAQTYEFVSCSAGVTLKATIGTIITKSGPNNLGNGARNYNYVFNGTYSMTRGRSTLTSSGLGGVSILLAPFGPPGSPLITTFILMVPNANGDGPGTGRAREDLAWGAALQGDGDLLPNGLPQTLPPFPRWAIAALTHRAYDRIYGDGVNYGTIDSFGGCSSNGKGLGDPSAAPGTCECGDPISVGTGNLFAKIADYQTAGPNKLGFTRYYNSLSGANTLADTLGVNWRSNYDRHLRIVSATSVTAERDDGRQLSFTLTGGAWTTDSDVDLKLTNSGTSWTLTDSDDSVETYRTAGTTEAILQTIRARNGYTQTLEYNTANQLTTVTDSFNRKLAFTYGTGLLRTVATPDVLTLTYAYTASGANNRLTSVSYSTSPPTSQTYVYDNTLPAALTGIVDENDNRYATWTYDSIGRALSSQHSGGANMTHVLYNDVDGSRTVTNAHGVQTVYRFTTLQGASKVTQIDRLATSTTAAATMKFTYDSNGYVASQTDWNGNLTNYVNDSRGQPTSVVKAAGTPAARTTTTAYHSTFHLPVRIVEPGMTTTFTYDSFGNLLTKTISDTTTTTVPYSTNGVSRTWTYGWSNGLLASAKKPRADVDAVTQFTYDSSGALTATTNALGQVTRITQNLPGGWPQTVVDPNGVTTQLTYDARQRLLTRTVGTATTTYSYDKAGNQVGIVQPDGSALTNVYDAAHRLTGVTDLFGQRMTYTLNALGGRTQTSTLDASGQRVRNHTFGPDALGRTRVDVGGLGQTTAYTFDSNGNALTVTDPSMQVTQRTFDAFNRIVRVTDAAKGITTTTYDAHGRPTSVTDPNGGTTSYVYNGFGDMIQRGSPDSGTTVYRYDLNGNRTQRVDANGSISNYTYDALDRMTAATYPGDAAENVTYTYDETGSAFGIGRLTTLTDAVGTLTRSYDERGNVLKETRLNGAVTLVTAYTYDAANRVASITYPSGWTVAYKRDAMGRVIAVTAQGPDGSAPVPVLTGVGYQPFGPVNALTFGNGVTDTRTFDVDYRMTSLATDGASRLQSLTYAYDASNNVTAITDGVTSANSQSFGYDPLERLTRAAGGYGSLSYTYDGVGNRLTQSAGGSATTYAYAPRSNQLASVSAGGVNQRVGHTRAGHIDNFNPAAGPAASLAYNQAGRLASVTAGENQLARYTYDAFGQRLVKLAAETTFYQYDRKGRLLEETDGEGIPQVDYIYLEGMPVTTLSPISGQVYFLHNDRLGTPQLATDSSQNVVWSANYGPFGEMNTVPALIVQNLRLPGQEFDLDTGLYHNGFRDYVPAWGRYLQSDPIGLLGGLNTYGYAAGNPVNATDPWGLCTLSETDNGFRIDLTDDTYLTVSWQAWNAMTPDQQVRLLAEALIASEVYYAEPSLLEWLFRYVSGLVTKDEPPKVHEGPVGGGIRG